MSRAVVLTDFGQPSVLQLSDVAAVQPGPGQIRVAVRFAGVGPTDLAIRSGSLKAFPASPGTVLGFEAAGTVDAVGQDVTGVMVGDDVAVFLPTLGGYAELVVADFWVGKPLQVDWQDAAALPASGEAAVRALDKLSVAAGDRLLILGGTGSVGTVATQLAVARGATVIAAVRSSDFARAEKLGAIPVEYGPAMADGVRTRVSAIDAVMDAARGSDLGAAVELAGGLTRVITLSNPNAADLGVTLSGPNPATIPPALSEAMTALAEGSLRLRPRTLVPLADAAQAHRRLEAGERTKFLLAVQADN